MDQLPQPFGHALFVFVQFGGDLFQPGGFFAIFQIMPQALL